MKVDSDIGCTDTSLACRPVAIDHFPLHVPIPLVNLAWFESEALLKLKYLAFLPDGVVLELHQKNFILLWVLSNSLLCFLGTFAPVSNNHSRHEAATVLRQSQQARWCHSFVATNADLGRVFACALQGHCTVVGGLLNDVVLHQQGTWFFGHCGFLLFLMGQLFWWLMILFFEICGISWWSCCSFFCLCFWLFIIYFFAFLGGLQGCCMLLKCCFRSFLQESVYAFVQIFGRHVVVNDAEPGYEYGAFVVDTSQVVRHFHQLTLLLDQLNLLAAWSTLWYSDTLLFGIGVSLLRMLLMTLSHLFIALLLIKDRILRNSYWIRSLLFGQIDLDTRSQALERLKDLLDAELAVLELGLGTVLTKRVLQKLSIVKGVVCTISLVVQRALLRGILLIASSEMITWCW